MRQRVSETWTGEYAKSVVGEILSKRGHLATKQEMDRLESLTHATNKPQPFLRSSEGETGGVLWTMSHFHFADEGMALLSWRFCLFNIAIGAVSLPESFVIKFKEIDK